jgi:hypothetical protein
MISLHLDMLGDLLHYVLHAMPVKQLAKAEKEKKREKKRKKKK